MRLRANRQQKRTTRIEALARRCGAVACGLLIDRAVGEPPANVHPVAGFGAAMNRLEHLTWANSRGRGVTYALAGILLGVVGGRMTGSLPTATATVVSGRELRRVARVVCDRLEAGDLTGARQELPALVGRDTQQLEESDIAAAVIESVAENSVDAVFAAAFWGVVSGAGGAGAYRAINTMDAMVGHRNVRYENFGWAAARLDDIANWLPARLFAFAVMLAHPRRAPRMIKFIKRDASRHPSPNAGLAEVAVAAALGCQLGGTLSYGGSQQDRPHLGDGPRPTVSDARAAIALTNRIELGLVATLAAVWPAYELSSRLLRRS